MDLRRRKAAPVGRLSAVAGQPGLLPEDQVVQVIPGSGTVGQIENGGAGFTHGKTSLLKKRKTPPEGGGKGSGIGVYVSVYVGRATICAAFCTPKEKIPPYGPGNFP